MSNQIQYSIVDRRAQHGLSEYCAEHGIKLLTYGSVGGGLFSQKYLGKPAPKRDQLDTSSREPDDAPPRTPRMMSCSFLTRPLPACGDTTVQMYAGTIRRFGSWDQFQELLQVMAAAGAKHGGASIAAVAQRCVSSRNNTPQAQRQGAVSVSRSRHPAVGGSPSV